MTEPANSAHQIKEWSTDYDLGELLVPVSVRARKPDATSGLSP